MEWILLIFLLALIPAILSLVLIRRAKQRFHNRIRRIRQRYQYHHTFNRSSSSSSSDSFDNYREAIGDISCVHNAHSPYLRCAINPYGPCEGCLSYESHKRVIKPASN